MKIISYKNARQNYAEIGNCVDYGKDRIVITRRDKPLAALIPAEDIELIEVIEEFFDNCDADAALTDAKG